MNAKQTHRSRLNPWPVSIIAFFAVAILGCGGFVAFCSRHPADLVAADYYEQEVRYQRQMERTQRANEQAQLTSVSYDAARKVIRISLPPKASPAGATGDIQLYRPSAEALDRRLKLELDGTGAQTIDAATLAPGLWQVRVSWRVGGEEYFVDKRVVIGARAS